MTRLLILGLVCSCLHGVTRAEMPKIHARGDAPYKGAVGLADTQAAIDAARRSALAEYVAGVSKAQFELFKRNESHLLTNINQLVPSFLVIDLETNRTIERLTVTIEASINTALLEYVFQLTHKSSTNIFVIAFVARELATRTSYLPKVTTGVESEASKTGVLKVTGGNTEYIADKRTYRTMTVGEVDNAVNAVLTTAHYETVTAVDAGLDMAAMAKDYGSGDEIRGDTRATAIKVCQKKGAHLLAVANMDVGQPETDGATGLLRVYVTVTAKVTNLRSALPTTIASIAAKPYAGLGPNPQVATLNALNAAATSSALALVDQLRLKGK